MIESLDTSWIPPGAWMPEIGERVRVRLSGECQWRGFASYHGDGNFFGDPKPHFSAEDGRVGVVFDKVPNANGHIYHVLYEDDGGITYTRKLPNGKTARFIIIGRWYALAEIEPVEAGTGDGE